MSSKRKVIVGIFLIGGILLFTVGLFWIGNRRQLFSESIEIYTEFHEMSGLKSGSKVLVAGMDAGEVQVISVPTAPGSKFRVKFRVLEEFQPILRKDSVASIQIDGLVGSKILQVEAGTKQSPEIKSGDTIPSREPVEISDVIDEAVETVKYTRGAVEEIRGEVQGVVQKVSDITQQTGDLITNVGGDVKKIVATGNQIAQDAGDVVAGVKAGRGTVGKLVTDDRLYDRMRGTMRTVEATAQDMQETSSAMKGIVSDLKSSDIAGNLDKTVANVRDITEKGKDAMSNLLPSRTGEEGLAVSLRETLSNANEAMSDFAENTEALKHNWFFKGFFRKRGFFDLDAVSVEDYQAGRFAPDRVRRQKWLHESELFSDKADGTEELTEEGKRNLDTAMAGFLRYARTDPIVVEGYASEGTADEQFLQSLDRARKVRTYLIRKFELKSDYVGVMPMGAVKSSDSSGKPWDGVSLVLFLPKDAVKGSN
jgi:phospholipid/cholesterol/gamma-HCH transport system substrate-binding protein